MERTDQGRSGAGRQFQFVRCIGVGGFGEVYLAEMSTSSGFTKMVAVKLLKDTVDNNPNVAQRMRDEARLLGMLRHRTIVRADDLISLAGRIAVIMEYVPGCNLTAVMDPGRNSEVLPHTVVLSMVYNVASALDVAFHRPSPVTGKRLEVLHRDIKPGNIRMTPDGEVKVLDFGIARAENIDREAQTTEYQLGSLNYMAPELLTGGMASPGSDVYALGVTFFECLDRGRFGWAGESEEMHTGKLEKRIADLDMRPSAEHQEDVLQLLREMMGFDPVKRPSPAEVVKRARSLMEQLPGLGIEDWAGSTVAGLKDAEVAGEEESGDLTGKVLFEELSTASFHPQAIGMFQDEATLAVPEVAEVPASVPTGRSGRGMEKLILVLLLGIAGSIAYFVYKSSAPDNYRQGGAISAKPPARKAEAAPVAAPVPSPVVEAERAKDLAEEAEEKAREDKEREEEEESGDPVPIKVASMPMGLPVFVDGRPVGSTPLSGLMLKPGKHRLLIKDGSKSIKKTIKVRAKGPNKWKYVQTDGKIR